MHGLPNKVEWVNELRNGNRPFWECFKIVPTCRFKNGHLKNSIL